MTETGRPAGTILLVDDEASFRENIAQRLRKRGFEVLEAGDGEGALELAEEHAVDVALLDILMPGMDGMTLLRRLKERDPRVELVMVTGAGSIESAVQSMQDGAFHYITKPVSLRELDALVQRALEKVRLARQNQALRSNLRQRRATPAEGIVAESAVMKKLLEDAAAVAALDSNVLVAGETGTGKEVLAELLHQRSRRCEEPFVVLNCGALSETLVDAELFGAEKGAYTGSTESKPGMVEIAHRGTLLLDEIGDIPPSAQIRLLRFIERGLFRRVGSTREKFVDVRVIAATHRDLAEEVRQGRFREDLYHRLHIHCLLIPPLRDRKGDIRILADFFLRRCRPGHGPPLAFDADALDALDGYGFPGNVRELSHIAERACFAALRAGSPSICREHLGLPLAQGPASCMVSLKEAERLHVLRILAAVGHNRQKAAEILGISERHLYRLLQRSRGHGTDGGAGPSGEPMSGGPQEG